MKMRRIVVSGIILLGATLVVVVLFSNVYRPWARTWGTTEEEVLRAMPGDQIVPQPTFEATRAVTIDASPEQIWPWIIQIGYRRAGFCSYDRLDNDGIASAGQRRRSSAGETWGGRHPYPTHERLSYES